MAGMPSMSNNPWRATGLLLLATSMTMAGQTRIVDRLFPPAEVTPTADRRAFSSKYPLEDLMRSGYEAYKRADYGKCLSDYQRASAYNPPQSAAYKPTERTAQNMIGNCAKELADYPTAITAFKKALELDPEKYYNPLGLASSYSLAGMKGELQAELDEIDNLKAQGRMQSLYFVSDKFPVGDKTVRVSRWYPRCAGCSETYMFDALDSSGRFLFRAWYGSETLTDAPSPENTGKTVKEHRLSLFIYNDSTQGPQKRGVYKLYGSEQSYEVICRDVSDLVEEKLDRMKNKILSLPNGASGEVYMFQPAPGLEAAK